MHPQLFAPPSRPSHKPVQRGAEGPVPYIVPVPVYVESAPYVGAPEAELADEVEVDDVVTEPAPPVATPDIPANEPTEPRCREDVAGEPDSLPPHYFIALKDKSVYTAIVVWTQGQTLHYVTPQGSHNQVSLDLVDRRASARLNANGRPIPHSDKSREAAR